MPARGNSQEVQGSAGAAQDDHGFGLPAFDYDAAIQASLDEFEKEKLRRRKQQLFADLEARRRRYVESGKDAQGNTVDGKYKANQRLMEAALREDEYAKMIKGSGLNERLKRQGGGMEVEESVDLEDPTTFGDVFGDIQELEQSAGQVVVLDIAEGVQLQKPKGWMSALKDRIVGGTRFDSSGRVLLEQRMGVGKPKHLLVKPIVCKTQDRTLKSYRTVESLRAAGISDADLRANGWLDEVPSLANGGIKPLGTAKAAKQLALKQRLEHYSELRQAVDAVPACETGIPGLNRKRGRENSSDTFNTGVGSGEGPAAKKRRGAAGKCHDSTPTDSMLSRGDRRVNFAEDA